MRAPDITPRSERLKRAAALAITVQLLFACSQNLTNPAPSEITEYPNQSQLELWDAEIPTDIRDAFRVVSGRDFVTFEPGKAELSSRSRITLERQALWLKDNPAVRAQIIGFADRIASSERDAVLAARRAQIVRDYLVLNEVSVSQVTIIPSDAMPPLALADQSVGRAMTVIEPL